MTEREKVIKGLEETEIMLTQAVDRGGEMAVMEAFKCLNRVTDALALLKEQEVVEPVLDIDTWKRITSRTVQLLPILRKEGEVE